MKNKNQAFTLIELLVVIVIIGILATVSTATFGGAIEKARFAKIQAFVSQLERGSGIPLGFYSFSEGAGSNTTAGKDLDMPIGVISGATWVTDSPSGDGSAVYFDGNDTISFAGDGDGNGAPIKTISFWAELESEITSSVASQLFIRFYPATTGGAANHPSIGFGAVTSLCRPETFGVLTRYAGNYGRSCGFTPIEIGAHHFAIIWNNSFYDIYIDGEKQSVSAGDQGYSTLFDSDLLLVGLGFTGKLDNIQWYSEAFDPGS